MKKTKPVPEISNLSRKRKSLQYRGERITRLINKLQSLFEKSENVDAYLKRLQKRRNQLAQQIHEVNLSLFQFDVLSTT